MKKTIITAFSYSKAFNYSLQPDSIRGDIKKVVGFSLNNCCVTPNNIYLFTDILPKHQIVKEIFSSYVKGVLYILSGLGYNEARRWKENNYQVYKFLNWAIENASISLKIPSTEIIAKIHDSCIITIKNSNIIEYLYLFGNYFEVKSESTYYNQIEYIIQKRSENLLFYFSGHGVRKTGKTGHLLIPSEVRGTEQLPDYKIMKLYNKFNGRTFLSIFDCCHAELFSAQHPLSQDIIFIGSSKIGQTSGFYTDIEKNINGSSAFTHFFFKNFGRYGRDTRFINLIESEINHYRNQYNKPNQDIHIFSSRQKHTEFYSWIKSEKCLHAIEL